MAPRPPRRGVDIGEISRAVRLDLAVVMPLAAERPLDESALRVMNHSGNQAAGTSRCTTTAAADSRGPATRMKRLRVEARPQPSATRPTRMAGRGSPTRAAARQSWPTRCTGPAPIAVTSASTSATQLRASLAASAVVSRARGEKPRRSGANAQRSAHVQEVSAPTFSHADARSATRAGAPRACRRSGLRPMTSKTRSAEACTRSGDLAACRTPSDGGRAPVMPQPQRSLHVRPVSRISREEVAHLAHLARIDLTDDELDRLARQLR